MISKTLAAAILLLSASAMAHAAEAPNAVGRYQIVFGETKVGQYSRVGPILIDTLTGRTWSLDETKGQTWNALSFGQAADGTPFAVPPAEPSP
jgi:hypothetical protein